MESSDNIVVNEIVNDGDVSVVETLCETVDKIDDSVVAAEVAVYATVNFDHSPQDVLSSNDLKTVEGIVHRHEHLRRNIKKFEFGSYDTGRGSNGYHHTIFLVSSCMLILLAFGTIPECIFGNSLDKTNGRWAMELW